jgi:hypothetical protein
MTDFSGQLEKIEHEIKFKLPKTTRVAMYTFSAISILLGLFSGVAATAGLTYISFFIFLALCDIWISIFFLFFYDKVKFTLQKKTLKNTIKYDILQLSKMLNYPFDDLSKEPDEDMELHTFYALRDKTGYRNSEKNWCLAQKESNGDVDRFANMLVTIENFANCEKLLHKNGLEWTIKIKGQKKRGKECNYSLTEIDELKCSVSNDSISDFLTKRWEPFLRVNIDQLGPGYNPFIRIAKKSEKPVKFIDLWWCWKIINEF